MKRPEKSDIAGGCLLLGCLTAWARYLSTGAITWVVVFFSLCGTGLLLAAVLQRRDERGTRAALDEPSDRGHA